MASATKGKTKGEYEATVLHACHLLQNPLNDIKLPQKQEGYSPFLASSSAKKKKKREQTSAVVRQQWEVGLSAEATQLRVSALPPNLMTTLGSGLPFRLSPSSRSASCCHLHRDSTALWPNLNYSTPDSKN